MFEEFAHGILTFFVGMWLGYSFRVFLNTPNRDDDDSHE